MYSIRRKLSIILAACTVMTTLLTFFFVNAVINNKFNEYMKNNQNKRNERIVQYFREVYKRDKKWTETSGAEMQHEAYMSNYCLTLKDENQKIVWTMDPNDPRMKQHKMLMQGGEKGIYKTKEFPINYDGKMVGYVSIGQYSSVILSEDDANFKVSVNKGIAASVIITILIAVLISLRISKQFSEPITEVAKTSVNLSSGSYNWRCSSNTNIIELENLRNSINDLGEKLQQQDLLRKRLVSDISHEIRTPLNILQNNLEAMIDGIFPVTTEGLISLNDEVIRFGKLLDNLNILKEIETEETLIKSERFPLDELLVSLCEDFLVLAKEKNIELVYNKEFNKNYEIIGDIDKLKQVFINLIANAVKFTDEYGKVYVNILKNNEDVIVVIKDTGIGIKEEDIPFIFERLYRGDKSRNKIEGSGIGLTIVKKILTLHCASIDVVSKESQGTTFTIHFKGRLL